jgi:hypothetical protein
VLIRGVVHHEIGDDAQSPRVRGVEELLEVLDRTVRGMDRVEVRDVVPVVPERRRVHRQDPQAVDAELLDVVEALGQSREVADPVAVAVLVGLDVDLVEDGVLVPVPRAARGHRQRSTR